MSETTGIEWCDSTANPVVGCDGCELHRTGEPESHCYAARLVGRYAGLPGWPASFDRPELFPERIKRALAWPDLTGRERPDKPWLNGRPCHIFWCDLGDPWTERLPVDWLAPYLPMLADSPHVHIFCTKRPARARQLFELHPAPANLILLTTVTSEATIGRVKELLFVPGISVRGVSLEPMLGPVDVIPYLPDDFTPGLDWVIVGGESGPGARPMHPDWARSVRDQCQAAGVWHFFKQWGEFAPVTGRETTLKNKYVIRFNPLESRGLNYAPANDAYMYRVGKRAAGRLLDGREWSQMPEMKA